MKSHKKEQRTKTPPGNTWVSLGGVVLLIWGCTFWGLRLDVQLEVGVHIEEGLSLSCKVLGLPETGGVLAGAPTGYLS